MEKKIYGIIYLLIDGTNDFEYVGQTTQSLEARYYQHVHSDLYVDRMIQDHGDLFLKITLKVCYSRKELDYWEKRIIKSRGTMFPNGYNLTEGGEGGIPSDKTRAKMSVSHSGEKNAFFGKHHTKETREKMSAIPKSPKARLNMSIAKRAKSPYKNLIAEMDKHQFSYNSLSKLLNSSQPTFSEKIRGNRNFNVNEIAKLVEIFGVSAEILMARDDGETFSVSKRHKTPFKNLMAEMIERKFSYTTLAKLLGLSQCTVSEKMSDKYKFSDKDKAKLVEIFNKPIEYLLQRDYEPSEIMSEAEKSLKRSKEHRGYSPFKNLLNEMDSRQLSYKGLAKLLGVGRTSVHKKMSGKQDFTEEQVSKLVEIFDCPAEYLLQRDDGIPAILSAEEKSARRSKERRSNTHYKNLLRELDEHNLSYTALAKILNLSRPTVSDKMRDKQNFTAEQIAKLVEIFNKPADYLMKRDD